ncbi:MAG: hypothetical protein COV35_08375 [Alphaproteobacteria bacterium CG11_big_fil_rev_8_21_14_0_20_39_49]|nr:MAG: hypothetical protein COV35_08375 [Alphaproteobacteria bacterium CG11_big_fil_rev_8_21_14_0_20_39_49]
MHVSYLQRRMIKCRNIRVEEGFTLIELSVVIVIIGLIVAGVVGGGKLVEQTKLRSIISDVEKFDTAYNTFRLEYNALPGDMSNASNYWSGIQNGNGDKNIVSPNNSGNGHDGECWNFWVHLGQNAGELLPAPYTTVGVSANMTETERERVLPLSDMGSHWGVYNRLRWQGHQYVLGASDSSWGHYGVAPSLTPKQTFSVDNKIDDGIPATGWVIVEGYVGVNNTLHWHSSLPHNPSYAQIPTSGNCTASGAASYDDTAQYNVGFDEVTCVPVFRYRGY